ncbi:MAG: CoA ester lyase [Rhodocyclales bacterium]|nr:MAG: CoA ester lyase [Rhodocyclales bacterium]
MNAALHPAAVLYREARPFPALPACEHYAGSEKLIGKGLALQQTLGPVFDLTCDCEDGAPAGAERAHAEMVAATVNSADNRFNRVGARIHDITHPHWRDDLEIIVGRAGRKLAYVTFPKVGSRQDAQTMLMALAAVAKINGIERPIPAHVLIETHGALREVEEIAALPGIETLDFGLMDFVSGHHGAIPSSAMKSPGQFEHPLVARAKCAIAAAALGHGLVPSHNVTTELHDTQAVYQDARRAREQFGYLRMWSIHPNQVQPIVDAMRPQFDEVNEAVAILLAAQAAGWGPIRHDGRLHDRASYRYYWELLQRAHTTGMDLPAGARQQFFSATA